MLQHIEGKIAVIETELTELRRRKLSLLQSQLAALQASLPVKRGPGRPRRQPASNGLLTGPVNSLPASSAAPRKRRGRKPGKRRTGK